MHILAFGAHPDDVEISIAGTIIKHSRLGYRIGVVDLTKGELGTRGNVEIRAAEAAAAATLMGLTIRENLALPDGFIDSSPPNRMKVIEILRKYQPSIILLPMEQDRHPDHGAAGKLVREACFLSGLRKIETEYPAHKPSRIFHYFLAWEHSFSFIVDISPVIKEKMEAIRCYASQFYRSDSEAPPTLLSHPDFLEWIESRARGYGGRIGVKYGEPFYSPAALKIDDLNDIHTGPYAA